MNPIETRRYYHLAMAEIEVYLAKGFDNLTSEEDELLEVLCKRVSEYEKLHFPMPVPEK
jgi:antitoxin component HigA of HigAB toxin-antitoxin module